jgi:hypothetical protein
MKKLVVILLLSVTAACAQPKVNKLLKKTTGQYNG